MSLLSVSREGEGRMLEVSSVSLASQPWATPSPNRKQLGQQHQQTVTVISSSHASISQGEG